MDMNTVIGFKDGKGYCIHCGELFHYNAIHPECFCSDCRDFPTKKMKGPSYCHRCGSNETIEHDDGKGTRAIRLHCKGCGDFRGIRVRDQVQPRQEEG